MKKYNRNLIVLLRVVYQIFLFFAKVAPHSAKIVISIEYFVEICIVKGKKRNMCIGYVFQKKRRMIVMKKRIGKSKFGILNCLALVLVTATANAACAWYFHQPEFPKEANALRKHYND